MRLTQDQYRDIAEAMDEGESIEPTALNWDGLCHAAGILHSDDVKQLTDLMGYEPGNKYWEKGGRPPNYLPDNFHLSRVMFALLMAELCKRGEYERLFKQPKGR
jgi:hypothetical protein